MAGTSLSHCSSRRRHQLRTRHTCTWLGQCRRWNQYRHPCSVLSRPEFHRGVDIDAVRRRPTPGKTHCVYPRGTFRPEALRWITIWVCTSNEPTSTRPFTTRSNPDPRWDRRWAAASIPAGYFRSMGKGRMLPALRYWSSARSYCYRYYCNPAALFTRGFSIHMPSAASEKSRVIVLNRSLLAICASPVLIRLACC